MRNEPERRKRKEKRTRETEGKRGREKEKGEKQRGQKSLQYFFLKEEFIFQWKKDKRQDSLLCQYQDFKIKQRANIFLKPNFELVKTNIQF